MEQRLCDVCGKNTNNVDSFFSFKFGRGRIDVCITCWGFFIDWFDAVRGGEIETP